MGEGLPIADVGTEIGRHGRHHSGDHDRRDRLITIAEAVLLSVVTLLAAWSGYCGREVVDGVAGPASRGVDATRGSEPRRQRGGSTIRNFDSSTFEAWFAAYIASNDAAMRVAEHRFRPEFRVAFDAWRATNPETNANAPPGPTFMPEYKQPGIAEARALDEQASDTFVRASSPAPRRTSTCGSPSSSRASSSSSGSRRTFH